MMASAAQRSAGGGAHAAVAASNWCFTTARPHAGRQASTPSRLSQQRSSALRGLQCGQRRPFAAARRGGALCSTVALDTPLSVVVTGAGGRTGLLALQQLQAQSAKYSARGIVRTDKSATKIGDEVQSLRVIDITADGATAALEQAFSGVDALIIATSAVPQLMKRSLIGVFLKKLFRQANAVPQFRYVQMPEQVDWEGQKVQIDAAKKAGIKKVVLVSSMGGTDKDNRLNSFGNGNILIWKRKAEEYLIASGLNYTIIHPGGLINEPGGERELMLGVDDNLIKQAEKEGTSRSIPRADVATLAIATLTAKSANNRSIDIIAKEPGDGTPTADFEALFAGLQGNCKY